ncbi:MAG: DnaJ C-terminal domain-containing protein, partial [Patescibacteria group bacterium]
YTEIKISYPQAVLGDTIEIDTVDGRKKLIIPEGTQPGQKIRLKGRGVGQLHGSGRGDQYVVVIVDVPKRVSRKANGLLQDLEKEL